jgi:hypothetical protein
MVALRVNGQEKNFDGDPSIPVLWYLRDILGMTGTKFGCWCRRLRRLHNSCRWRGGSTFGVICKTPLFRDDPIARLAAT